MTFQPFALTGKTAIVTGANRGIGKSIALILAQAGAKVALVGRNLPQLEEVATAIRPEREALVFRADVSVKEQIDQMVAQALEAFGHLDILVNNAGVNRSSSIEALEEYAWDEVLNINLKGAYLCTKSVVPSMRKQGSGRIINIASISGQTGGVAAGANYSASKGGMIAMTKTLARELASFGITVNAIAPGQIDTSMGAVPADRLEKLLEQIPLRRLGTPEDIAYATLFFASDETGYITGATLDVNGGILRR